VPLLGIVLTEERKFKDQNAENDRPIVGLKACQLRTSQFIDMFSVPKTLERTLQGEYQ
jgi:hypothetical protein